MFVTYRHLKIKLLVTGYGLVLGPQTHFSTRFLVATLYVKHKPTHRRNAVSFPPPSLVVSTMTVPHYKLGSLCLSSTVQGLTMELGDDQEGSIWLIVQMPQFAVSRWLACLAHDNFDAVITFAPWNIQDKAIEAGFDVMLESKWLNVNEVLPLPTLGVQPSVKNVILAWYNIRKHWHFSRCLLTYR